MSNRPKFSQNSADIKNQIKIRQNSTYPICDRFDTNRKLAKFGKFKQKLDKIQLIRFVKKRTGNDFSEKKQTGNDFL